MMPKPELVCSCWTSRRQISRAQESHNLVGGWAAEGVGSMECIVSVLGSSGEGGHQSRHDCKVLEVPSGHVAGAKHHKMSHT